MSLTLLIALNAVADATLLGLLALVMCQPARLRPHRPRVLARRSEAHRLERRHAVQAQRPLVRRCALRRTAELYAARSSARRRRGRPAQPTSP